MTGAELIGFSLSMAALHVIVNVPMGVWILHNIQSNPYGGIRNKALLIPATVIVLLAGALAIGVAVVLLAFVWLMRLTVIRACEILTGRVRKSAPVDDRILDTLIDW